MPTQPKITWDKILDIVQTFILIAGLALATTIAYRNDRSQANRDSGDFMLRFDERIHQGEGGVIVKMLDRDGNLNNLHLNKAEMEDALADFFNKYELLDQACNHGLINKEMAFDAFQYYLDKAFKDKQAQQHIIDTYNEDGDVYGGVLDLAKQWNLSMEFMGDKKPASQK